MTQSVFRIFSLLIIAFATIFILNIIAFAAEITYDVDLREIQIVGNIERQDYTKFQYILEMNPNVVGVRLGPSDGGFMFAASMIGVTIKERDLYTVAVGGHCNSACAYIWVAGVNRYYESGMEISQHLPTDNGEVTLLSIADLAWYMGKLDYDTSFLFAIIASSDSTNNYLFNFIPLVTRFFPNNVKMISND